MALRFNWGGIPYRALPKGALPWLALPQFQATTPTTGSAPFFGAGTQFQRGDGASIETFTALALVRAIEGPTASADAVDTTDTDCADRRYVAGYLDAGEMTLDLLFQLSTFDDVVADFEDNDPRNYRLVMSDDAATEIEFTGIVTAMNIVTQSDEGVGVSMTIKLTGPVSVQ